MSTPTQTPRNRTATVVSVVVAVVVVAAAFAYLSARTDDGPADRLVASAGGGGGGAACAYQAEQGAKGPGLPPAKALPVGGQTAALETSRGRLAWRLDGKAPCTSSSFAFLAGKGYFDGTSCHRLTSGGIFVLQCGDPAGDGTGGPGYTVPDENLEGATYARGTVAMANTGQPGTGGSQFFLVYKDSQLPPTYTPWGTLTPDSLQVLDQIAAAGSDPAGDGAPKQPVQISKASVSG